MYYEAIFLINCSIKIHVKPDFDQPFCITYLKTSIYIYKSRPFREHTLTIVIYNNSADNSGLLENIKLYIFRGPCRSGK